MLDFPSPATNGQKFTGAGATWTFDGIKWGASGLGANYLPLAGGVMTGPITLAADPTLASQAATKNYVDTSISNRPSPLSFPFVGKPAASAKISVTMPWVASIAANFTGSVGFALTVATASAVFIINQISAGVTTQIGTATFTGTGVPTFAGAGATFAIGDTLQVVAPSTQDATLADLSITLYVVL